MEGHPLASLQDYVQALVETWIFLPLITNQYIKEDMTTPLGLGEQC